MRISCAVPKIKSNSTQFCRYYALSLDDWRISETRLSRSGSTRIKNADLPNSQLVQKA